MVHLVNTSATLSAMMNQVNLLSTTFHALLFCVVVLTSHHVFFVFASDGIPKNLIFMILLAFKLLWGSEVMPFDDARIVSPTYMVMGPGSHKNQEKRDDSPFTSHIIIPRVLAMLIMKPVETIDPQKYN
jgi:hypothetical protein